MFMRRFVTILAVSIVLVGVSWAHAAVTVSMSFGDTATYWPGWTCHSSPYGSPYSNANINALEHLGVPDLLGGNSTLVINSATSQLSSITLDYNSNIEGNAVNRLLKYGDLFLDVNADGKWEYVVRSPLLGTGAYSDSVVQAATSLDIRKFAGIAENSNSYMLSNTSTTRDGANWNGYVVRYDHPWALLDTVWDTGIAAGEANFSGWQDNKVDGESTYDFGNNSQVSIPVDGDGNYNLRIGFALNCANDVLYEAISVRSSGSPTVPEPATIIIWSLLGAATWLGMRVARRGRPVGRRAWSPEERQAILKIVARH
jgi:hypothetical protein